MPLTDIIFIIEPSSTLDKGYIAEYSGYYSTEKAYILLFNLEASQEEECISEAADYIEHEVIHAILDVPELDKYDIYRYYEEVIVQKLCGRKLDDKAKQIIEELLWIE